MDSNIALTLLSTLVGIVAGFIASFWSGRYFSTRKKTAHKKIQDLEWYAEYICKLRESTPELLREACAMIFLILFCLSVGIGSSIITNFVSNGEFAQTLVAMAQFLAFGASSVISFSCFRTYIDMSNYERAIERIERKKSKLKDKVALM